MEVPEPLHRIVEEFAAAPPEVRIELLVEYAGLLPPLPAHLAGDAAALERVEECQTPFFLATEVDQQGRVEVWFDCPPEAPTMRGFAGVLSEGLRGASVAQVLALPADFYLRMGLGAAISPLRLRAMDAILFRLKRNVATRSSPS